MARDLLSNIPRLDGIAWIIGQQRPGAVAPDQQVPESLRIGAQILRAAITFDDFKIRGLEDSEALSRLQHDHQLIRASHEPYGASSLLLRR